MNCDQKKWILNQHFRPMLSSKSGQVEAQTIFLGYGITAAKLNYDDYAGIEARSRIGLVYAGEPGEDDANSPFDGKRDSRYGTRHAKILNAKQHALSALIFIDDELPKQGARGHRVDDSGLITLRVTATTAVALLGFNPKLEKMKIDKVYKASSRPGLTPPVRIRTEIERPKKTVHNVGAVLEPGKSIDETVVIGGHYDHLGYGGPGSLAETSTPSIHHGADDNASGVAAILEVAKRLKKKRKTLSRSVMFLFFAGEEAGLLGSAFFTKNPPVAMESIVAMVNLDMVGHLRSRSLNIMGTDSAVGFEDFAKRAAQNQGLIAKPNPDAYGPSDHTSFYAAGVPVLFLFTGAHEHYHRPSDTADTLNYPGLAKVSAVATDLLSALSRTKIKPLYQELPPPKLSAGTGYGPYFGSIPEFGEPVKGVRLTGVRKGSPAEQAGLRKGDTVVEFNGLKIENLMDYTVALRQCAPGDAVAVRFERGEAQITTTATLTRRK